MINGGNAFISLIHVDDAVRAIVAAINNYETCVGKTIHVVDDKPVQWKELLGYAKNLSGNEFRDIKINGIPTEGASGLNFLLNSVRVENGLVKRILNWQPNYSTYREGLNYEYQRFSENFK